MVQFRLECVLALPAHAYVIERDTAAFRSLYAQAMRMGRMEVVEETYEEHGNMVHWRCFPDKEKFVPGPLRRFIRGDLIHQEKWFYDTAALSTPPYVLRFQQIPPLVGANADITGTVTIEPISDTSCRQILHCTANVKPLFGVPGTGRIAAQGVKEQLADSYRLLPTVVEKWVVLRQALLDADGMGGAALWEGDKALRHLSSAVLANIRSPPPALLAALAGDSAAAAAPVASIARIERRRATSGGSEESSHYSAARTRLSRASSRAAPSPPETRAAAVARSTWRQWLFGFAEEDAVSICPTEEEFYDTAEYFYFESGAEGITEAGLLQASGGLVERQPGLVGGVHDTAQFNRAAESWAQFWSRLGIDVLLDERKPRKRVLVSQQLLCLAAVGGAVVGATAGVIVGLTTAARKRKAENAAHVPSARRSNPLLALLGQGQNASESN